jgi:hypothetical protein
LRNVAPNPIVAKRTPNTKKYIKVIPFSPSHLPKKVLDVQLVLTKILDRKRAEIKKEIV